MSHPANNNKQLIITTSYCPFLRSKKQLLFPTSGRPSECQFCFHSQRKKFYPIEVSFRDVGFDVGGKVEQKLEPEKKFDQKLSSEKKDLVK